MEKDASRHVEDPAQLGDRQAGQGRGRVRCDVRRQRLAEPADGGNGSFTWKVTVTHSQMQTYAVTGQIRLDNSGTRRRHRRRRLRLAAGRGDRLRQRAEHGRHGARQQHGELRLQRHAGHAGGEQHRHGDVGLGRLGASATATIAVGRTDRGRRARVGRGRRSDRPVARSRRSHERLVDEDVRRAVDVQSGTAVAERGSHEHRDRDVGRRHGLRQRERSGRMRHHAASAAADDADDSVRRRTSSWTSR